MQVKAAEVSTQLWAVVHLTMKTLQRVQVEVSEGQHNRERHMVIHGFYHETQHGRNIEEVVVR